MPGTTKLISMSGEFYSCKLFTKLALKSTANEYRHAKASFTSPIVH